MKFQKQSTLAILILSTMAAACTPNGRPLGEAVLVNDGQQKATHLSPVSPESYANALRTEQEAEEAKALSGEALGTTVSANASTVATDFNGQIKITVTQPTTSTSSAPEVKAEPAQDSLQTNSKDGRTVSGKCRLGTKDGQNYLFVEMNQNLDDVIFSADEQKPALKVLRGISFAFPVENRSGESEVTASLMKYTDNESKENIQIEDPKTVTSESQFTVLAETSSDTNSVKFSGNLQISARSQDDKTTVKAEGVFSCNVDTQKVLEVK